MLSRKEKKKKVSKKSSAEHPPSPSLAGIPEFRGKRTQTQSQNSI